MSPLRFTGKRSFNHCPPFNASALLFNTLKGFTLLRVRILKYIQILKYLFHVIPKWTQNISGLSRFSSSIPSTFKIYLKSDPLLTISEIVILPLVMEVQTSPSLAYVSAIVFFALIS